MDLNITCYLLLGVLLVGYAVLDGFDLGVGVLHLFAKDENERQVNLNAIGPFWDGNEVWLVTFGGVVFAAFPPVYATVSSSFYLAVMLLLFALIFRAVALEFRHQLDGARWRRYWDLAFAIGSLLVAVILGVAAGNVLRGLPIDAAGAVRLSFPALLNPYALLVGLVSLALCVMQGAAFLTLRTEGDLQQRLARWAVAAWMVLVVFGAGATAATFFVSPFLLQGLTAKPPFWVFVLLLPAAVVYLPVAAHRRRAGHTFAASTVIIGSILGLTGVALFPRLVPSTVDLGNSLTIYNASATPQALTAMLIITLIVMPVVLVYTAYLYKAFMGKVRLAHAGY